MGGRVGGASGASPFDAAAGACPCAGSSSVTTPFSSSSTLAFSLSLRARSSGLMSSKISSSGATRMPSELSGFTSASDSGFLE